MSLARFAKRRDANELGLVKLARQLGAVMIQVDKPNDWWCGFRGVWMPVEIKMPKGGFTDAQNKFHVEAKANGLPVWIWREAEDVLASLQGNVRSIAG